MSNVKEAFARMEIVVPVNEIENIDDLCKQNLHLRPERMSDKLTDSYAATRTRAFDGMECKAVCEGFVVEGVSGNTINFEGGMQLESPVIAEAFGQAKGAVVYAVVAHGFEELVGNPDNSMVDSMMYGGWGVAFSTGAHQWLEQRIRARAHEIGLYSGKGWIPGQEGVELDVQRTLFEMTDPSTIGLELDAKSLMRPVMAVAGIAALGDDPSAELEQTAYMV